MKRHNRASSDSKYDSLAVNNLSITLLIHWLGVEITCFIILVVVLRSTQLHIYFFYLAKHSIEVVVFLYIYTHTIYSRNSIPSTSVSKLIKL